MQIATLIGLGVLTGKGSNDTEIIEFNNITRTTANKLHSVGIIDEAINMYEKYLESNTIDKQTRANISYSLGELYEKEGKYEKALSCFYQVEISDPKSKYVTESSKKVVALLEKLKKLSAAKMALTSSTSLNQPEEAVKGAKIVAKIGNKNVFDYEINEALDQLPEQLKNSFKGDEGKKQMLQKFVADELLYQKASRLQYDSSPEVIKKIDLIKKQLMIEKIITDEIQNKIKVEKDDLENYFKANKEKFTQNEGVKLSMINVKGKKSADSIAADLNKGTSLEETSKKYSGTIEKDLFAEKNKSFHDFSPEQLTNIFATKPGKSSKPILNKGIYYIAKIESTIPRKEYSFEEVKQIVEQNYKMEKSKNLYQQLIQDSVKGDDIKLYPENL